MDALAPQEARDDKTHEFHIYHVQDLIELSKVLQDKKREQPEYIFFEKDINFGDLPLSSSDTVKWEPFDLRNPNKKITLYGKQKQITCTRGGERCKLPSAIFKTMTNCEVSDLRIDLDVAGEDAKALLADRIENDRTFDVRNITYAGQITQIPSSSKNTDNSPTVGGLVAEAQNVTFVQCETPNLTIESQGAEGVGGLVGTIRSTKGVIEILDPKLDNIVIEAKSSNKDTKSSNSVGGLVGKLENDLILTLSHPVDLDKLPLVIHKVSGGSSVGGLFGEAHHIDVQVPSATPPQTSEKETQGYAPLLFHEITGEKNVGGISGEARSLGRFLLVGNRVHADWENVGGVIGAIPTLDNDYPEPILPIHHMAINIQQIHSAQGANVGGVIGTLRRCGQTIQHISIQIDSLKGNDNVAGLVGLAEACPTEDQPHCVAWITSDIQTIEGTNFVSGLYNAETPTPPENNISTFNLYQISSFSHLFASLPNASVNGLAGSAESYNTLKYLDHIVTVSNRFRNNKKWLKSPIAPVTPEDAAFHNVYFYADGNEDKPFGPNDTNAFPQQIDIKYLQKILTNLEDAHDLPDKMPCAILLEDNSSWQSKSFQPLQQDASKDGNAVSMPHLSHKQLEEQIKQLRSKYCAVFLNESLPFCPSNP